MENYQLVTNGSYLCGESPIWDYKNKKFYWCDLIRESVYTLDGEGKESVLFSGRSVGGFSVNVQGGFICSTLQGIYLWDEANGFRLIADEFEGEKLACNDSASDAEGRFLFGSDYYDAYKEYPLGKLYIIDKAGRIRVLDEGIHLSNGIGFSPDNRILYYADTGTKKIYAYDYDIKTGVVGNKRVFVDVPEDQGLPDGLTVDAEGYVWSAQWYGGGVMRYDPDGAVERKLDVPAKQTTSLIFGGDDFYDIYVTTAEKPAWLHLIPKDYDYENTEGLGGPIYKYNLGIQGKAEYFADISPF